MGPPRTDPPLFGERIGRDLGLEQPLQVFEKLHNYYLIFGVLFYAIAGVLLIIALRGGEVSVLYPIIATSYVWVSFLSITYLGESMNVWRWLGVSTIILGIVFIGYGSTQESAPVIEV